MTRANVDDLAEKLMAPVAAVIGDVGTPSLDWRYSNWLPTRVGQVL